MYKIFSKAVLIIELSISLRTFSLNSVPLWIFNSQKEHISSFWRDKTTPIFECWHFSTFWFNKMKNKTHFAITWTCLLVSRIVGSLPYWYLTGGAVNTIQIQIQFFSIPNTSNQNHKFNKQNCINWTLSIFQTNTANCIYSYFEYLLSLFSITKTNRIF